MKNIKETLTAFAVLVLSCSMAQGQGQFVVASGAQVKITGGASVVVKNMNVNIESGSTYDSEGDLVIESGGLTNAGTAHFNGYLEADMAIANTGEFNILDQGSVLNKSTITGVYNAKMNLKADRTLYISSPIESSTASSLSGGFAFDYLEKDNAWQAITTETHVIENMKGYAVEFLADHEVVWTGNLYDGSQDIGLSNLAGGWNLLGNPYPIAIDWKSDNWTKTGVGKAIYSWDDEANNYSVYLNGDDKETGINLNERSNDDASLIAKGQGFFVKATSDNASLTASKDVRVPKKHLKIVGNSLPKRTRPELIRLQIVVGSFMDETVIFRKDGASSELNYDEDAEKLFSPNLSVPQLYSISEGDKLAINALPLESKSIKLGYITDGQTLGIMLKEGLANEDIWLVDKESDDSYQLEPGLEYAFATNSGEHLDRFELIIGPIVTSIGRLKSASPKAWYAAERLYLSGFKPGNSTDISVLTLSGQQFMQLNTTQDAKGNSSINLSLARGVYIIKVRDAENQMVQKIISR